VKTQLETVVKGYSIQNEGIVKDFSTIPFNHQLDSSLPMTKPLK